MIRAAAVAVLAVTALTLAGCGGGGGVAGPPRTQAVDINPQPRDNVRDGGDLRLPLGALPDNFNFTQTDGSSTDVLAISRATLPAPFVANDDGTLRLGTDMLTSAELTSTDPQVVTYTINPKAAWTDGTPLSWRDFESYWRSQNGSNPGFQTSGTVGYSDIVSVARGGPNGTDDRTAVVTFKRHFAEWKALFDPFLPASLTGTPAAFNSAWRTGMPVSAGPFAVDSVDPGAKTVTLRRDPRWWGTPAKLDRIIYRVVDPAALPDALANNEIDYYDTGSSVDLLRRAQNTPGAVVRNAPSQLTNQLTLNGAAGAILSDVRLRRAIAKGIDRVTLTQRMIRQIVPDPTPTGNHVYPPSSRYYRDNGDVLPFDPAAANRELDELGWVRSPAGADTTRVKDGRRLELRMIYFDAQTNLEIVKTVQNQLAQIGVTVVAQVLAGSEITTNINRGNFDLVCFAWGTTPTPLSSGVGIYTTPLGDNVRQNYGRIASPEIDARYDRAIQELDDTRRAELGNQVDRLIWGEVHSIPLYGRPGTVAVRAGLANYGAPGLADVVYSDVGFQK